MLKQVVVRSFVRRLNLKRFFSKKEREALMKKAKRRKIQFVDTAIYRVRGGTGGNGCNSFNYRMDGKKGMPNGGNGGDGGNVFIRSKGLNRELRTSSHFYTAEHGQHGTAFLRPGKKGKDVWVEVPAGTVAYKVLGYNSDTNQYEKEQLFDFETPGQVLLVARGGAGGSGNLFIRNHLDHPWSNSMDEEGEAKMAGKAGEELTILCELKTIAHVGLVGFPNAGKSTLLGQLTSAKSEISAVPFTTLSPHVGYLFWSDALYQERRISFADLPGIVEDASKGRGLGFEFLRHVARSRVLLFVLDGDADPVEELLVLRKEIKLYDRTVLELPTVVFVNKMDLVHGQRKRDDILRRVQDVSGEDIPVVGGSALNGDLDAVIEVVRGLEELETESGDLAGGFHGEKEAEARVIDHVADIHEETDVAGALDRKLRVVSSKRNARRKHEFERLIVS